MRIYAGVTAIGFGVLLAMATVAAPASGAEKVDATALRVIHHVQSGLCLDGSVSNGVRLNTCNGATYQQWDMSTTSPVIRHSQSGLCLDGSVSNGVRLNTCNGATYQQWSTSTGYDLKHRQSGLCLDGSVSNGVRLNACNGTTYQQWTN